MKSKILLLHADGTQALPFAKSLNRQGYQVGGVFLAKSSYEDISTSSIAASVPVKVIKSRLSNHV